MARNMTRSNPRGMMVPAIPFSDFGVGNILRGLTAAPVLRELEQAPRMKVDVEETDQAYILRAEVPGAKREDIAVTVDGNTVTIVANMEQDRTDQNRNMILSERIYGEEYRVFNLPQDVDESKADARMENGVLVLSLPKKTGGHATRLNIQQADTGGGAQGQSASGTQAQSASSGTQSQTAGASDQAQSAGESSQKKSS
jgi:HSP20 family protein